MIKKEDLILIYSSIFFSIIGFATLIQLMNDNYRKINFFDTKVQIVSYHKTRYGNQYVTVKEENNNRKIKLNIPDNCKHMPINKIIDLSLREKVKSIWFFIEYNEYMYIGKGPCL